MTNHLTEFISMKLSEQLFWISDSVREYYIASMAIQIPFVIPESFVFISIFFPYPSFIPIVCMQSSEQVIYSKQMDSY